MSDADVRNDLNLTLSVTTLIGDSPTTEEEWQAELINVMASYNSSLWS
jgi:hypothetical protein